MKWKVLILAMIFIVPACAELQKFADQIDSPRPLTQDEVVRGLKQALVIGTDSAAARLSAVDGYYRDQLVRIVLPPEAAVIVDNISLLQAALPTFSQLILSSTAT